MADGTTLARPMRPRVRRALPLEPEAAFETLRARLVAPDCPYRSRLSSAHLHAELRLPRERRRPWSPCFSLEFRPPDDGADGSVLHGLIGPHPAMWTFFAFLHFGAVVAALFGLILGWSQWSLDEYPWGLWVVPLSILLSAGTYAGSLFGQRLARSDMEDMSAFVDDVLPGAG